MRIKKIKAKNPDPLFLAVLLLLLIFGLFILSSASFINGEKKFGEPYYYVREQLFKGIFIGIIGFLVALKIPPAFFKKYSLFFLVFSIGLLATLFIPPLAVSFGGSVRWLQLGPLIFQPGEIIKLAFIIYLASWLGSAERERRGLLTGLLPFLLITGFIGFLLLIQPNMGTFGVIAFSAGAMYFAAGGRMSHMFFLGLAGLVTLSAFIFLNPYGAERFKNFLNPKIDPLGSGYQINQAMSSIGVGGLTGIGLKQTLTSAYLPEPIADSIFAVLSEKLGLFGVSFALFAYLLFGISGYRIARKSPDLFSKLLVSGITSWFLIQTFLNIAAISGLAPLTGVPLPFMSYGSSAMVVNLTAAGIIANISRYKT